MTNMYYVLLPTYYLWQAVQIIHNILFGWSFDWTIANWSKLEWELRSMCYPIYE